MDGYDDPLKRDKTCSFVRSLHTPLVSGVQLNECGNQQWRGGGLGQKRDSLEVLDVVKVRHSITSSDFHLLLIFNPEKSGRNFDN